MKYDYRYIFREIKGYYNSKEFHSWQARGGRAYAAETGDTNFCNRDALEEYLRNFERTCGHEQSTIFDFI